MVSPIWSGHEFEQVPGVDDGQGSLACCSPWGRKKSDMTEQLSTQHSARCSEPKSSSVQLLSHACPTLCDSMDCSLSGSSVHGIL